MLAYDDVRHQLCVGVIKGGREVEICRCMGGREKRETATQGKLRR